MTIGDAGNAYRQEVGWHVARDRIETADGRTVVVLFGDVDMAREAELIALFSDAAGMGQPVVFDAAGVDFIDSTGLRVLLIAHKQCAEAGTMLAMRNVSSLLETVLEMSGIDGLIPRVS